MRAEITLKIIIIVCPVVEFVSIFLKNSAVAFCVWVIEALGNDFSNIIDLK